MTATLAFEQHRAINDLLAAERQLRDQSERHVQELRQLILETAVRLDGERFEAIRRDDPSVPSSWTVANWRMFLRDIPNAKGWGASVVPSNAPTQHEKELFQQVESLKEQLNEAFRHLEDERKRSETVSKTIIEMNGARKNLTTSAESIASVETKETISMELPEGVIPMEKYLVENVRSILKGLPKRPPAPFDKVLDGGNRVGGDLARVYQRYWMAVYLIGKWGLCASMEIENVIAKIDDVSSRTGSLRRILEDLTSSGIFVNQKLEMDAPKTALVVNHLSESGMKLYQELFKEIPIENEWLKIIGFQRSHLPEKTLAILLFSMHARKCGWMTKILSEMASAQNTDPDVWIGKGEETFYVNVELSRQEPATKWTNLTQSTGGCIAICAGISDVRQRLAGDCKLDKVPGVATDIETLVKMKYKNMDSNTSLWIESW